MNQILNEFRTLDWGLIKFGRLDEAILIGFIGGIVLVSALVIRYFRRKQPGKVQILLPAVLPEFRNSSFRHIRHLTQVLILAGLPFFFIALADPYVTFVREVVSYPGRRIAILVDASGSMSGAFATSTLKTKDPRQFYTAIATADYFIRMRMNGMYNDLIAFIEFGNESHIVAPFTNDYRNILTSVNLIGEPGEWQRFTDGGTIISKAMIQAVELFRVYDFLEASGNIIVIISDGEDWIVNDEQRNNRDRAVEEAVKNKIPMYFIRTNFGKETYEHDAEWIATVEKTGGKFFPAHDEPSILRAIAEIDKAATGRIDVARYLTRKPVFIPFLLTAGGLWSLALLLTLTFRPFRKFP